MSGVAPRQVQITFDCADPRALSLFWCEVLGYQLDAPPPGFDTWDAALEAFGVPEERRNDASACGPVSGSGSVAAACGACAAVGAPWGWGADASCPMRSTRARARSSS